MCVCLCVCVCVCVYVCMYVCMYARMYVCFFYLLYIEHAPLRSVVLHAMLQFIYMYSFVISIEKF